MPKPTIQKIPQDRHLKVKWWPMLRKIFAESKYLPKTIFRAQIRVTL